MDQIQQLLDILKQTPSIALWGVGMYFLYTLLKLASVVMAIKSILELFITKLFEYKTTLLDYKKEKLMEEVKLKNERKIKNKC
jgi:hypothetical protein